MAESARRARKTPLDKLNELIDWYEKFRPQAGQCIQVQMNAKACAKMLGLAIHKSVDGKEIIPTEFHHRGRTILPVGIQTGGQK